MFLVAGTQSVQAAYRRIDSDYRYEKDGIESVERIFTERRWCRIGLKASLDRFQFGPVWSVKRQFAKILFEFRNPT